MSCETQCEGNICLLVLAWKKKEKNSVMGRKGKSDMQEEGEDWEEAFLYRASCEAELPEGPGCGRPVGREEHFLGVVAKDVPPRQGRVATSSVDPAPDHTCTCHSQDKQKQEL